MATVHPPPLQPAPPFIYPRPDATTPRALQLIKAVAARRREVHVSELRLPATRDTADLQVPRATALLTISRLLNCDNQRRRATSDGRERLSCHAAANVGRCAAPGRGRGWHRSRRRRLKTMLTMLAAEIFADPAGTRLPTVLELGLGARRVGVRTLRNT